ncbi:MAG: Metallophosphoesterase [Actinomycetota bacterium]|jgi:metallophosphoesterase (TIGR03767 family)|nr:Metallophosphoesterase [Actinomycetota bacterium]
MDRFRIKVAAAFVAAVGLLGVAIAQAAPGDTLGVSTTTQRLVPDASPGFNFLTTGPGEGYTVRDGSEEGGVALGTVKSGREARRTSISYFGQLTDFQLADEESPLRVEFLDPEGGEFTSSWRPGEALNPQEEDAMIRQFNAFSVKPPHRAKGNVKPKMDFVVNTGDISDNNQYNEALWNLQLIEGKTVDPSSGVDPASSIGSHPLCPTGMNVLDAADPAAYTGVQDRSDWPAPTMGYFWDPDQPNPGPTTVNPFEDWPTYPGLMDRAQRPFKAAGLKVPSYQVFGNHDSLVQGNAWSSNVFNQIATGCLKPINDDSDNSGRPVNPLLGLVLNPGFTAQDLLNIRSGTPEYFMEVPPDPERRLISKKDHMNLYRSTGKANGHGFGFVDKAERTASNGFASYYSFSPRPGVRYISMDTTSEGGKVLTSDKGNLDDPQFRWIENQLKLATRNNEIVVLFSHHAAGSMTASLADEAAPACAEVNPAQVPGCDGDPRNSEPIHLGTDVNDLLLKYPVAVAWVAGHSHVNDVTPFTAEGGGSGFWSIRTSALADWPKQNRLIEIFDNRDGNLSIFGTVIDHAAGVDAPADGTAAANMGQDDLASLSRVVGHNDNQTGAEACGSFKCGEGEAIDRNVELLIKDPRKPRANVNKVTVGPKKRNLKAGKKFKLTVKVSNFITATADAKKVTVRIKSSNNRVKVRSKVVIAKIQPGRTATVKVPVRALGKARGKSKITVTVNGRKAVSNVKVIAKKRKRR